MILLHQLIEHCRRQADRPAFLSSTAVIDYDAFLKRIRSFAGRLREMGIQPGDRVLLCAPNSADVAAAYFAIHWIGAAAVPVDPGLSEGAVASIAQAAASRLLISHKPCPGVASTGLDALASPCAPVTGDPLCEEAGVADILFTTGTTGDRKGVVLTHAAIAQAAVNISAFVANPPDAVEMVPLPLSHSFGLGRLRSMALVGNGMVLERGMLNVAALLTRLQALNVTGFACVPSGWEIIYRIAGNQFGALARNLRYIEIGSMAMKPLLRQWLLEMLPHTRICHHYGLTEASRAAFTEYHADAHKGGTIGKAAPNVTITVRDDAGNEVEAGQPGELVIQGGMILREYWQLPELTRQRLTASGFRTGDEAFRDADGCLYLLGRKDDIINVGGKKVSPEEVEEALKAIPGIQDAACIGAPDPEGITGHVVKAFLVARNPVPAGLIVAALRKSLAEHQLPRIIESVPAIPRTESGKVQRHRLRGDPA